MTRTQRKKLNEDLYYEKDRTSISNFDEAETLTNDTHNKVHKELEKLIDDGVTDYDLMYKLLKDKYPNNIVLWQINKLKEVQEK